jgi:hypothetical protein
MGKVNYLIGDEVASRKDHPGNGHARKRNLVEHVFTQMKVKNFL